MFRLRYGMAFSVLLFWAEVAVSCSCEPPPTIAEAFERSELVAWGKVVGRDSVLITHSSGKPSRTMYSYAIVPDRIFKGIRSDTLHVYSGTSLENCGFMFSIGETYVVYADVVDVIQDYNDSAVWKTWVTSKCTRTRVFDEEEVRSLEKQIK